VPQTIRFVSLFYSIYAVLPVSCGSKATPDGYGEKPQPKSNFVHFALKADIWWHFSKNQLTKFRAVLTIKAFRDLHDRLTQKYRHAEVQFSKTVATVYHLYGLYGGSRKVLNAFETLWHIAA